MKHFYPLETFNHFSVVSFLGVAHQPGNCNLNWYQLRELYTSNNSFASQESSRHTPMPPV